jgi:hypothetical protein
VFLQWVKCLLEYLPLDKSQLVCCDWTQLFVLTPRFILFWTNYDGVVLCARPGLFIARLCSDWPGSLPPIFLHWDLSHFQIATGMVVEMCQAGFAYEGGSERFILIHH